MPVSEMEALYTLEGAPTLPALLSRSGLAGPDEPAMIFDDGASITRGELLERAERFAGYLAATTKPGESIAVVGLNRVEYMVAWFASAAAGTVLVALNPDAGPADLGHVLTDSGAVLAVCDEKTAEIFDAVEVPLPAMRERLVMTAAEPAGLDPWTADAPLSFANLEIDPKAITNVYYTSGSTGKPKGCMVDHRYWGRIAASYLEERGAGPDDRILCCLKFFYNDPSWLLLVSLYAGAPMIVMRKFSVSRFWKVVNDHDVTQLFTIGSIPALLLSAAPSELEKSHKVRFGIQVAIDPNIHQVMTDRWNIPWTDTYGLTETGGLISVPTGDAVAKTGSGTLGKPRPDVEAKLVDDEGNPVAVGEIGELLTRSAGMMSGYLNRPDATAEAIDEDGWFHTGDRMRTDEDGWYFFVGRKKDIIRRAGENISAAEVEETVRTHPAVIDAGAVPVKDPLRDEEVLVHAYVDAITDGLAAEILAHCATKLAKHKVPRYLVLWDEDLPRTPSMRVAKQALPRGDVPPGAFDREAS